MICYVDEEKLSFNRKLREGAGGKSNGSSGSKGRDSKSSSKPKPSTSNNHKASRDSSNDVNSMRKEQQSVREYNNNNNNNKNNNKASRDSSNDVNSMRKEQQSVREYNKEYNNNLKYDSAINANSMRKEQQAEREFNKAYNNSLKYNSTINTDTMKQEQLVIRKINDYLNRNNASDANLMKQEQLMIKKIDAYNGRLKANADGLNGASYSIKNSVTGLNEAITIIDKIKNVSGNNLSQQETNLAMQLASLEALLIEANAGTKDIDKIVNNIMDMYTRFEKQQSGKKEIILNEYGKPDLKNWTAEAVLDYAEKEVNNYFTGLHNKQIKENLKNSKTIGEAMGYMGDIAGSTISNALYNISKGVAKSFENVDDALHSAYLLLKDGNKTWTNEKLKDAGKEVKKSRFEETIHNILFSPTKFKDPKMEKLGTQDWNDWSIEENIKDIIEDKTTNWFNTNFKLNEKDQNGITRLEKFEKNSLLTESSLGGQVMQNFGQMVPNIVLGNVFGAAASLGTLYAKSFGSSAESAYNMGATIDDASTYAALSAGVEVFTEKMFGIVGGIVPKGSGWLDNVITYASKTGELLGGAVGEVFEEHLSNLAQPIIKSVTINRDSSIREMMKEDFLDAFKNTTLVTLGTTALCNLLGYSMGAIKAKIEYNNVLEYSNNIPEGSKTLINEIIKYDDTSTTSQPEKIQSNQSNQQNPKINNNTPLLTKSFNINDIISFFIKKPLQLNSSKNNIQNQSNIVEEINRNINQKGSYILPVKSTIDLSVDMLNQVNDLSKLQVQILSGFADFNGKLKSQYNNSLYIDRITYTGYEALSILTRIEELSSRVDMKLPTMERARQIYELIANEYSYFERYEEYQNGHKIVASLRGITNNNSIGREGLVCAGYAALFKEMCTRAGILCDYITGESDGVRHAWNVVVDGNKIIPVDVTWKTTGGKEWFGSSEEFQRTHKAFSKEIFKKYDDSSFYSNYIESQKWSINQQIKQESPNQQIDIIVNQNNSNVIYSSASDVVHNIKDQITIPDNLKIIEKALNSGDDYYEQLVCCHTKQPKTLPSIESVNKFYNKFNDSSRYWRVDQGNNFSHIGTHGANGPNLLSKLFLNIANYTDALNFCIMFADKCNESNIPFYFKTIKANNGKVDPFQLTRDESIVIYSSDQYLANYVNIINEIKNKTNIQFEEPPILAGVIDGYIGFGQDRHIPHTSYNQNRSKLLNDAVKFANEKLSKMYPSRSITSILNEIRNNPSTYKTYLDDITMYIKENAIYLEINPEKLFLNSYNQY